jgi:hypothetical protein
MHEIQQRHHYHVQVYEWTFFFGSTRNMQYIVKMQNLNDECVL